MNNNKLHYYLPHEVVVIFDNKIRGVLIGYQPQKLLFDLVVAEYDGEGIVYKGWCSDDTKMFLYPLSCLTETIIHNGVEEIPLVELAKIEGTYKGEEYEITKDEEFEWKGGDIKYFFGYDSEINSFYIGEYRLYSGYGYVCQHCYHQLLLFDYLYSRRINIWGIDAIDPRTLEVNPYLITSKK